MADSQIGYLRIVDPCTNNPCQNGGTCEVEGNSFRCACPENFSGDKCEIDPCTNNPCENGGTCKVEGNSFRCVCPENFSGDNCENDDEWKNVCDEKDPCQNGGTCKQEDGKDYKCHCMEGFNGTNCEIIQWCQDNNETCGNTPCEYDEEVGSALCSCKDDLYFDAKSKTCVALDKCLLARIKGNCKGDHETCDKMGNCICEENYAYNDDRTACEPDFCWKKLRKPRCGENMDCIEGDQSFSCSCKKDFRRIGSKCVKADKCAPGVSKCEQICTNGKCSCFPGFNLKENYTCDPIKSGTECELDCGKGTCVKEGKIEKCICPQISHVFRNNTCIDKCKANVLEKEECPMEMGCLSDEELGYKCNCTGKYDFADDGVHCKDKLMCSDGDGYGDCLLKGAVCEDNFTSSEGYTCKCKFGYKENPETHICEHMCEMADCAKKQALCTINVNNTAECICPPLLLKDADGTCNQLAKYSYLGDFSVPKRKYEVVTGTDSVRIRRDTSKAINYAKLLKDFEDSMNKIFDGYKGTSILNCIDEEDDWKCSLEIKLIENPQGKIDIISTPSVCIPLSNESYCLIQPDFITKKRTANDAQVFHKTNPCDKAVIGKLCGNETECEASEPGFKCKCKSGYFPRTTYVPAQDIQVDVCEDIDECLNPEICPNTTRCSNRPGSYICECKDGHLLEEGNNAKKDGCRAVCDPNPCVHGACSVSGKDGFSCSCEGVYTGRFCNQTIEAKTGDKNAGVETAVVGGILGAFLVVAIIICIILFRKVRKSKSIDDTEENMRQGNRGLVSDMWRLGRRQPENQDMELRDNERRPNRENEDLRYSSQLRNNPIDSISIPRPQLGRSTDRDVNSGRNTPEMRESGDYRRGYSGDDRMFPKAHSSRQPGEEAHRSRQRYDDRQELPRRPLSRSSDHLDTEKSGVSRMQYRNRGYEEE
ncbi:Fat-like cadherin-related tumor suppressor [Araneus ventricosus]|uniref:Fat-like cadherin-related tumor suppressor n=1 Tax=Araneus ventricosus TaxID=182803 RepID=A0A4Y2IT08_ARAVE|nr:Fat-like cadherin-related tumor suppressor [Araneus ventricosus]